MKSVKAELSRRRATAAVKQKVFVSSRRFYAGGSLARVLVDGRYYDVTDQQISRLEQGQSPQSMLLVPIEMTD